MYIQVVDHIPENNGMPEGAGARRGLDWKVLIVGFHVWGKVG